MPGCKSEATRAEPTCSGLLHDVGVNKTKLISSSYVKDKKQLQSHSSRHRSEIPENTTPLTSRISRLCPASAAAPLAPAALSEGGAELMDILDPKSSREEAHSPPCRQRGAPSQTPTTPNLKERKFLFYYSRSASTGTAWELLNSTGHSKPTQRSFPTEVTGLVCFTVRWIRLCPLGLIPKSFSRKDSCQLSSVNCLIASDPTDVDSNKGWSPLHCAPEQCTCVTTHLSPLQPPPGLAV